MTIEEMNIALADHCATRFCENCACVRSDLGCYGEDVPNQVVIANYHRVFSEKAKTIGEIVNDVVNHPGHYTQGGIECVDAMKSAFGAHELAVYCKIAAFKYIWRCEHKNGLEDIKKAVWYLNKYIELQSESTEVQP